MANLRKAIRNKGSRIMTAITALTMSVAASVCAAFAAPDSIESGIKSGMSNVYNIIKSVAPAIAVVGIGFVAASILFGGQKGMEKGKNYAIILVIALGVLLAAPLIVSTVVGWFSGMSTPSGIFN